MEDDLPVPLVNDATNNLQSILFLMLTCTSTISKSTTLMDGMHTTPTIQTTSREPFPNGKESCTAEGMTLKSLLMRLWRFRCLNPFSQGKWNNSRDPNASCYMANWGLTFFPTFGLLLWKSGYDQSEPDLNFTWLATIPTLVLELSIVRFTLVVLLSRMIFNEKTDMLPYTPVEFN